jgi:hypothetical protein
MAALETVARDVAVGARLLWELPGFLHDSIRPEEAGAILRRRLERQNAERAYDELMAGFDERGRLPTASMPVFWEIAVAAGEVSEPWPESRFFDRQFVDTFDEWAPR